MFRASMQDIMHDGTRPGLTCQDRVTDMMLSQQRCARKSARLLAKHETPGWPGDRQLLTLPEGSLRSLVTEHPQHIDGCARGDVFARALVLDAQLGSSQPHESLSMKPAEEIHTTFMRELDSPIGGMMSSNPAPSFLKRPCRALQMAGTLQYQDDSLPICSDPGYLVT